MTMMDVGVSKAHCPSSRDDDCPSKVSRICGMRMRSEVDDQQARSTDCGLRRVWTEA